jgi:hypothetical protein
MYGMSIFYLLVVHVFMMMRWHGIHIKIMEKQGNIEN